MDVGQIRVEEVEEALLLPGAFFTFHPSKLPLSQVQVSQYAFAMCSYKERSGSPTEFVSTDGFTVDYVPEPDKELSAIGGKSFFMACKEGNEITFATDDENER